MGTSSSYDAPKTPKWAELKAQVTSSARNGYTSIKSAKNILNDFINTSGGAYRVSKGGGSIGLGKSAQNVATRFANFISVVGAVGFNQALETFGLSEFIGKSINEIIPSIIEKIGGPSSTINDTDARNALSRLLDEHLSALTTPDQVEKALSNIIGEDTLEKLLNQFFGYYLYEQFCRVFYERLSNRVGRSNADSYLKSIFDSIKSELGLMTSNKKLSNINWSGDEGKNLADQILQDTFEIFGA
jgi:hypothetical protein